MGGDWKDLNRSFNLIIVSSILFASLGSLHGNWSVLTDSFIVLKDFSIQFCTGIISPGKIKLLEFENLGESLWKLRSLRHFRASWLALSSRMKFSRLETSLHMEPFLNISRIGSPPKSIARWTGLPCISTYSSSDILTEGSIVSKWSPLEQGYRRALRRNIINSIQ